MIVAGIIVLLIAVILGLLGLWITTSNSATMFFDVGLIKIDISPSALFIGGMVVMALLWLGIRLTGFGTKRTVQQRRDRRELERTAREQEKQLAETKARLGEQGATGAGAPAMRHDTDGGPGGLPPAPRP